MVRYFILLAAFVAFMPTYIALQYAPGTVDRPFVLVSFVSGVVLLAASAIAEAIAERKS
jgi:uncharacterized integral membrane protein